MKIRLKICLIALLPLLVLGVSTTLVSRSRIASVVSEDVARGLQATAISVRDTMEFAGNGNYALNEQGDLFKGDFEISAHEEIADHVRTATEMEVTVFYGDTRYMTSVKDAQGNRVLGTKASDEVIDRVLKNGQEYFAENVDVVGRPFFAYYIPLYDGSGSAPVGMVFAGMSREDVENQIQEVTGLIIMLITVVSIIGVITIFISSTNMVRALKKGVDALSQVAKGNLAIDIADKELERRDEIGDITRSIGSLKNSLSEIIQNVKGQSEKLNESSAYLQDKAEQSSLNVAQVEKAVEEIADGATGQASETQKATENVILIGNMVEETNLEVEKMSENAQTMRQLGQDAFTTLKELNGINEQAKKSIDVIYRQTHTTYESAQKIREATQLITNIAEETNLLSLNASIEAARAGEQGRGFAVVASQIQKLAEQSNGSARQIEEIIAALISDSEKAVSTMDVVKEVMEKQSENVQSTDEIFGQVLEGIDDSIQRVTSIADKTEKMDEARINVVDIVQNLTAIAEENAASTEETSASMTEVGNTIVGMAGNATQLKEIADGIDESMSVFRL